MRDPELVQRAERAAIALERAWERWRVMHGMTADPPSPVSSYVGYSLEEPWGQTRVVFGIGAEDAEQLASFLDGHDCVGPVYAEVAGLSDGRRSLPSTATPGDPAGNPPLSPLSGEFSGVPSQPARPAAESLLTAPAEAEEKQAATDKPVPGAESSAKTAAPAREVPSGAALEPAEPAAASGRRSAEGDEAATTLPAPNETGPADGGLPQPAETVRAQRESASRVRRAGGSGRATASVPGPGATPAEGGGAPDAGGPVSLPLPPLTFPVAPVLTGREADAALVGSAFAAAHSAAAGAPAQAEVADSPFPVLLQPGIVAFRRRQDHQVSQAGAVGQDQAAAAQAAAELDGDRSQGGPGYRGPRYQGYPPQYQSEMRPGYRAWGPAAPANGSGEVDAAGSPVPDQVAPGQAEAGLPEQQDLPGSQPAQSMARLGRSRRAAAANETGTWPGAEPTATNTAV